jgi:uncharacterized protein YaaR (DUF327 family)
MIEMEKTGKDKTNIKIKKKKTQKESSGTVDIVQSRFYDELKIAETERVVIEFDNLINEITRQGEKFSRKPTFKSLKVYKSMIMEFLKYVTKNMFAVEHNTGGSRIKQKIYTVTRIIDIKLKALTELIMNQQTDNIKLLATLDEIRGLLVDLYK